MTSSPHIFVEDFERTEYSDSIQAIIGRSLIVATRFDSLCIQLSRAMEIEKVIHTSEDLDHEKMARFVDNLYVNDMTLCNTIKSFRFTSDFKNILHEARLARNKIAHNLCKNLIGCIETNKLFAEKKLIQEIASYSKIIIEGDALLSIIMSIVTKEFLPNYDYIESYKAKLLEWVIEK